MLIGATALIRGCSTDQAVAPDNCAGLRRIKKCVEIVGFPICGIHPESVASAPVAPIVEEKTTLTRT
jgi:hypothetical protein